MNGPMVKFVLCLDSEGCDDPEVRKIYEVLPDEKALKDDYIRIIDESGEDYLSPARLFYPVEIAPIVCETLLHSA